MTRLYVSTFGKKVKSIPGGIPIEVGACLRDNFLYGNRDDSGNNISKLNPIFGELTGIYWIWKNVNMDDEDIIGFCHYNKRLAISPKSVHKLMKNQSWLVQTGGPIRAHSFPGDISILLEVLKQKDKKLYDCFLEVYNSDGSSRDGKKVFASQLYYTTWREYCHYCELMFSVLFDVFEVLGDVDRDMYNRRYIAFLGERILTMYLAYTNCKFKQIEVEAISEYAMVNFLKRFLPLRVKKSAIATKIATKLGVNNSSWR